MKCFEKFSYSSLPNYNKLLRNIKEYLTIKTVIMLIKNQNNY